MNNLSDMLHEVDQANALYKPSSIWEELYTKHLDMLKTAGGLDNFKRTINHIYSQWGVFSKKHPSYNHINNFALQYPAIASATLENPELFSKVEAGEIYLEYCLNLNRIMQGRDSLGLLVKISEPLLGNPIRIRQEERYISQDLAIAYSDSLSLLDFLTCPLETYH